MARYAVLFILNLIGLVQAFNIKQGANLNMKVGDAMSRRELFQSAAVGALGITSLFSVNQPAHAELFKGSDRLKLGYDQLTYLLENWEQETTACDANNECRKDPDKVRKYLGLRSTKDPLFQIEKVLEKAQNYIVDPDNLDDYIGAVEEYIGTTSMANSMAYTSSFGEYNPGGGKDAVEKYLEESRKQVVAAYKALGTIIELVGLK